MRVFILALALVMAGLVCVTQAQQITPGQLYQMNELEKARLNATISQLNQQRAPIDLYRAARQQFLYNITKNGQDYYKGRGMVVPPNPYKPPVVQTQPAPVKPYDLSPKGTIAGALGFK